VLSLYKSSGDPVLVHTKKKMKKLLRLRRPNRDVNWRSMSLPLRSGLFIHAEEQFLSIYRLIIPAVTGVKKKKKITSYVSEDGWSTVENDPHALQLWYDDVELVNFSDCTINVTKVKETVSGGSAWFTNSFDSLRFLFVILSWRHKLLLQLCLVLV